MANVTGTRTALESGRFEQLVPATSRAAADPFARLQLHRAPNDPICCYLTLQNVTVKLDKKGRATQNVTAVLKHLAISPKAYQELRQHFGVANAKPESLA